VIAGANGAGKSTLSRSLVADGNNVVDADAIAREHHVRAFEAGRRAIELQADHLENRRSFAIETTLFRRERGQAASCDLPRAMPGALVGGDSALWRMTRAALTSASSS
jgi:predicted kinase